MPGFMNALRSLKGTVVFVYLPLHSDNGLQGQLIGLSDDHLTIKNDQYTYHIPFISILAVQPSPP